MLHVITDRVNAALQNDPATAHLTLTVHDVDDIENRRYQFERRVVDPIIEGIP
jgi:hypothetical protein